MDPVQTSFFSALSLYLKNSSVRMKIQMKGNYRSISKLYFFPKNFLKLPKQC